jgi:hypothetical protein
MAHYRKLDVDGTPYEYSVGKSYVKIRGLGEFPKYRIGHVIDKWTVQVKPGHVIEFIKKELCKDRKVLRMPV